MATEEAKSFCLHESLKTTMVEEGGKCTVRVARFLKPCAMSVNQASIFPTTLSKTLSHNGREDGHQHHPKVHFKGWKNPQKRWYDWVEDMTGKHASTWNQTHICDALLSSMYEIRCNSQSLILELVKYWCPETNTFVFPWGEATITLEDVMVLGGFSVLGEHVNLPLKDDMLGTEAEMMKLRRLMSIGKSKKADHGSWMEFFMKEEEKHDLEHVGFLSLWLSRFVFPSLPYSTIGTRVFPIAIHLSRGTRMALAPAVLASIYENLRLLKQQVAFSLGEPYTVPGPFQLVQLWAIERFPMLGPKCPIKLKPGEPRAARWHKLVSNDSVSNISMALKSAGNFQWRPYAAYLKNWCFESPYKNNGQLVVDVSNSDELRSFGQCLCADELVGLGGCTEKYMPHRVAMQFGLDQHLPGEFAVMDPSRKGNFSFYVPASSYKPCVSLEYLNLWREPKLKREKKIQKLYWKPPKFPMIDRLKMHMQDGEEERYALPAYTENSSKRKLSTKDGNEVGNNSLVGRKQKHDTRDYTGVGTSVHPIDVDKY